MAQSHGVFIVFEGGDGAGKSTQVALLADRLRASGHKVVVTREPGGSPLGRHIRALLLDGDDDVDPRAEALLFAADRANHVATIIRPALSAGAVVVCDRYVDSSIAYQGSGRDLGDNDVATLSRFATGGLVPDLTVVLDVPPDVGRQRGAKADRIEQAPDDLHLRVRQTFLQLAAQAPERYLVLDAELSADKLADEIAHAVDALMPVTGRSSGMGRRVEGGHGQ